MGRLLATTGINMKLQLQTGRLSGSSAVAQPESSDVRALAAATLRPVTHESLLSRCHFQDLNCESDRRPPFPPSLSSHLRHSSSVVSHEGGTMGSISAHQGNSSSHLHYTHGRRGSLSIRVLVNHPASRWDAASDWQSV